MSGRKIEEKYENPFDNIIIDFAEKINPIFKKFNFTPNMLTTLSLIFGILSPYFIYIKYYNLAAFFYLLSYMFDCFDGNYARKYNMVTDFGDLYDHIGDLFKYILFIYIFCKSDNISTQNKKYII